MFRQFCIWWVAKFPQPCFLQSCIFASRWQREMWVIEQNCKSSKRGIISLFFAECEWCFYAPNDEQGIKFTMIAFVVVQCSMQYRVSHVLKKFVAGLMYVWGVPLAVRPLLQLLFPSQMVEILNSNFNSTNVPGSWAELTPLTWTDVWETVDFVCSSREEEIFIRARATIDRKDVVERSDPPHHQALRRLDRLRGSHGTRPLPRRYRPVLQLEEVEGLVSCKST